MYSCVERSKQSGGGSRKDRDSNLELLRIVLMLVIIAHHYVVNSGITEYFDTINKNTIFLQFWGMGGKIAINAFVLITGYFMCMSHLTWKRFAKIYLEAKFYRILFFIIFVIAGLQMISAKELFKLFFGYLYGINNGFTASFLMFYLFIPFYNVMLHNINKKQLLVLIGLLIYMFTIAGTFFFNSNVFHEVGWYATLYFIAAYIRLYPSWWMQSRKFAAKVLALAVFAAYASILIIDFFTLKTGIPVAYYYFVNDSHKILSLIIGVAVFLYFLNVKIKQSQLINTIASTTFGVLLIHANSNVMRQFLWKDLLDVSDMFAAPLAVLILHAILSAIGIFIVCSLIDYLRIRFVERPLFSWIDQHEYKIISICQLLYLNVMNWGSVIMERFEFIDDKGER